MKFSYKKVVSIASIFGIFSYQVALAMAPTLATNTASNITSSGATLSGEILNNGGYEIISAGFQYGLTTNYGATVNASLAYVFKSSFGSYGNGNGQFYSPVAVAVDSANNIFVVDTNNYRIQKFNSNGQYISSFGTYGTGPGQFLGVSGIAIDTSDNIYVVDSNNRRVDKFDSSGTYLAQFGASGVIDGLYYPGDGLFYSPQGVAVDTSGNVYVTDYLANRIQKFNSAGVYQSQFGTSGSGNGQFHGPKSIAIDSLNNIYVVDRDNNRIQKFNSAGVYQSQFGTSGSGNGQFSYPYGITIDSSNNIFVSDTNRIQKFNSAGVYQSHFSTGGGSSALGIVLDHSGNIYVADNNSFSVKKFVLGFKSNLSNLTCRKTYHYRAFATNSDGTSFGNDEVFQTGICQRPIGLKPVSAKPTVVVDKTAAVIDSSK